MNKVTIERILLWTGIGITVIYFLNLIILAALHPDYSHMSNYVSDLGRIEAPHHQIFNMMVILMGFLYLFTGLGYYYSVKRITGRNILAIFAGFFIAVFGVNYFLAASYPLPDPRHTGYGIGIFHFFTPLLLAWAFRELPDSRLFIIAQLFSFILALIIMIIQAGVGGLINDMNLGLFQRFQALILYTWFTFTCYWLIRYKSERTA